MPQVGHAGRPNGLRRLLIAPITADTASTFTIGAAVSLGAQSRLTWKPAKQSSENRTSSGLENRRSYVDHITWELEGGEINLSIADMIMNGKLHQKAESGVGAGDSKTIFALKKGLSDGYFAILGQPDLVEAGPADAYVCLLKCQADDIEMLSLSEGYARFQASGIGCYNLKDGAVALTAFLEEQTDMTFAVALTDLADALASGT